MLVDSEKLGSGAALSEAEKMQRERKGTVSLKGIVTYDWSADGKSILVPLDGVLYLAGVDGTVSAANGTGKGEMLNPVLSETGKYLSFVRDNRLWAGPVGSAGQADHPGARQARPLGRGRVHRPGGVGSVRPAIGGRRRTTGSPSSGSTRTPVDVLTRAAIGAAGTKTFEQRYPAAGHAQCRRLAVRRRSRMAAHKVKVDLGPDRDIYLARVDWAPDGKTLYVQR